MCDVTHTQDPCVLVCRTYLVPTFSHAAADPESRWRRFTCQNETMQGKNCFAASVCVIAGAPKRGGEMSKSGTFGASGRWGRAVDSPGVFRVKVMSSWMFAAPWKTSLLPWIFPMSKKATLLDPQLWCIARSTLPWSHDNPESGWPFFVILKVEVMDWVRWQQNPLFETPLARQPQGSRSSLLVGSVIPNAFFLHL